MYNWLPLIHSQNPQIDKYAAGATASQIRGDFLPKTNIVVFVTLILIGGSCALHIFALASVIPNHVIGLKSCQTSVCAKLEHSKVFTATTMWFLISLVTVILKYQNGN